MRSGALFLAVALLVLLAHPIYSENREVRVMSAAELAGYFAQTAAVSTPNLVESKPSAPAPVPLTDAEEPVVSSPPLTSNGKSILNGDGMAKPVASSCIAAGNRLKDKVSYYVQQNGRNRGYDQKQVAAVVYALIFTEDKCEKQGKNGYLNLGCGLPKFKKTVDSQLDCATQTVYNRLDDCSKNLVCALKRYSPEIQRPNGSWENRQGLYADRLAIARTVVADENLV